MKSTVMDAAAYRFFGAEAGEASQRMSESFSSSLTCIAISACLLGEMCRYDGSACTCDAVRRLAKRSDVAIIAICPERAGGLTCPRPPAEIVSTPHGNKHVVDATGKDITEAFEIGARETLRTVLRYGCSHAILKSKSPSCGLGQIYNGSFSGTLIAGDGITAQLLKTAGIICITEDEFTNGKF